MDLIGAVDIGGTKIAAGLVDASGAILVQEVCPTERDKDYRVGIASIRRLLERCMDQVPGVHLLGVGVACTGPVDPETGVLGPKSFLPLWEGVPMVSLLRDALGVDVAIENDADAAALGEVSWGAGQGASNCMYVTISTGIGCGLIAGDRVYRGAGGAHPELGHIVIDATSGPACYCGAHGCWESLASGTALAGWYNEQRRARGLPEESPADARAVCMLAEKGDGLAREAVVREGYYLGIGLANMITAFIPEVIVLGGGVMASWRLFEGAVHATIQQVCGMVPYERTDLRLASLGERTGLAGAARVWLHRSAAE